MHIMTQFFQPDLGQDIDNPFIRDGADKLVRRSYFEGDLAFIDSLIADLKFESAVSAECGLIVL
jgi:hypothetical protein